MFHELAKEATCNFTPFKVNGRKKARGETAAQVNILENNEPDRSEASKKPLYKVKK
jgi:hypothetical protein